MRLQACYEQNEVGALKPSEGMKWAFDGVRRKKKNRAAKMGKFRERAAHNSVCDIAST